MHTNYVQMPPDGVGKKIQTNKTYILPVNTTVGFSIGTIIVNSINSLELKVCRVSTTNNLLYTVYNDDSKEGNQFNLGDAVYIKGNVTPTAVITAGTVITAPTFTYVNNFVNVSADNPYNGQIIDAEGQALIRFSEGSQQLDATGQSKFSQETAIGAYDYKSLEQATKYSSIITTGNASAVDIPLQRGITLRTSGASGDSVKVITDKWHRVPIGQSVRCSFVIRGGDTGKNGLVRRCGYFDDNIGVFLEIDDTNGISIIKRSDVTGTVVDTRIRQSDWNGDKADGTGLSDFQINPLGWGRYWIDFYKTGKTRMGGYDYSGQRIIFHKFTPATTDTLGGMRSINLPLRFEQIDSGCGSTSEMFLMEADVAVESREFLVHTEFFEAGGELKSVNSTDWTPLVSLKPADDTHTVALLTGMSGTCCVSGSAGATDGTMKFELFKNASLSGDIVWIQKSGSHFKYNKDATSMSGGTPIAEFLVKGIGNFEMHHMCTYFDEFLTRRADGTDMMYTIAAKSLYPNVDVQCYAAITWEEINN